MAASPRVSPLTSPRSESVSSDTVFNDSERASSLLHGIQELHTSQRFCDVIINVGSSQFESHKIILAISSPYFMAMFSSDMQERRQERVEIREMSSKTMELVLEYIYMGKVKLTEDMIQNLLSAANLFQLISLRNGCAEYMMKHVTPSNCVGVFFFAKAHQCDQLAKKARELINVKFDELCKEEEFLQLPCDKLIDIIKDDELGVTNEEIVYKACLSWLMYDIPSRRQHLLDIMKHIRFATMSSYFFCDSVETQPLFYDNPEITEIIRTVKYYYMLPNRLSEVDLNLVPRGGMSYERGIIIMANPYHEDNSKRYITMEVLLPRTGEIKHLCKLPQSVHMPGACVTGSNHIYLAGGAVRKPNCRGPFVSDGVSPNMFLFDQTFGSWQVKAKMNFGRAQFALVLVDGLLYAIGGRSEHDLLDIVERYEPSQNRWLILAPLPKKMSCMTAVGYRGKLYCFGGETSTEITNSVFRYDPTEDCWTELHPMIHSRALAGCVVFKNKIYIIGGNSHVSNKWKQEFLPEHCISSVELLDPVTETWSLGPELPTALCGAGVIKFGDSIMVVGGEDDRSWMAGLFTLKEENGREFWVEGQELSSVMSTFGCVVANIPKDLFRENSF